MWWMSKIREFDILKYGQTINSITIKPIHKMGFKFH
jgi:hypothetical protein